MTNQALNDEFARLLVTDFKWRVNSGFPQCETKVWDPRDGRHPGIMAHTDHRSDGARYPYVIQILFRWPEQLMRQYVEADQDTRELLAARVSETFRGMGMKVEACFKVDLDTRSQENHDPNIYEFDEF